MNCIYTFTKGTICVITMVLPCYYTCMCYYYSITMLLHFAFFSVLITYRKKFVRNNSDDPVQHNK